MASINLQSKDDSRSPARPGGENDSRVSVSVSSPWSKIVSGENAQLSPPVVSVNSQAVSPSPSPSPSLSIQEQIMNASTDWYPQDTTSSTDESGDGFQPEGSDGGGNAVKKPVWSKPSNGVVEVVSPVMGAVSWPALGESTKAAPKSSSSESLPTLSDGSLLPAQVTGNSSPSSHKPASVNPTSAPNHLTNSGQRSMKRGGGTSGAYISSKGGVLKSDTAVMDSAPKESPRGGFGSQPNSGNDNVRQPSSYRRGNGGPYPRGEGSYHHNYGGKLNLGQGRGNQEWNQHRNFNRDNNMQTQRGGFRRGGYTRPYVHSSTPLFHPPMHLPMRPFGNNVTHPDVPPATFYFQGPPPPMVQGPRFFPFIDPLHSNIVRQIDYYFSNENLVKDIYFRRKMDEQGWVDVNVIAGFKKVSNLTDNIQLILDVMRLSATVEVQGEKMRRRNDWMRWLMPPAFEDSLASQLQGVKLDSRSPAGELGSQLQKGGGTGGSGLIAI